MLTDGTVDGGGRWFDPRSALRLAYPRLRARTRTDVPGVVVAAFDAASGELVGHKAFEAQPGRPLRTDVGAGWRYDPPGAQPSPPELGLFLEPVQSYRGGGVRVRVLAIPGAPDLRSPDGVIVSAIETEHPALLFREGLAFLILPTGDATDWPESARAAWSWLAPRPPDARWVLADGSRQLADMAPR